MLGKIIYDADFAIKLMNVVSRRSSSRLILWLESRSNCKKKSCNYKNVIDNFFVVIELFIVFMFALLISLHLFRFNSVYNN